MFLRVERHLEKSMAYCWTNGKIGRLSSMIPSVVEESATCGERASVRFPMAARNGSDPGETGRVSVGEDCRQEVSGWGAGISLPRSHSMTAYKCCMDVKVRIWK